VICGVFIMIFNIAKGIADNYPDLRVGIVVGKGITNIGPDPFLEQLRINAIHTVRQRYTLETLADHPHIRAWQEVYRGFGANPKQTPPTVEALVRRILKGKDICSISKAVDLYLAAEINALMPVGGYDLTRITGDIQLRFSMNAESFTPIGKTEADQPEYTKPGEIIYSDSARVLTRIWNYRDCDFAKITEQSTDIALFAESPSPEIATNKLEGLVEEMADLLRRYCGGIVSTQLVSVRKGVEFPL
jgi:DNA/RNA-binding domain of Phe-tRNA-synthetase-like protein